MDNSDLTWIFLDADGLPDTSVDPETFGAAAVALAKAIAATTHDKDAVIHLIAQSRAVTPPAMWAHLMAATLSTLAVDIFELILSGAMAGLDPSQLRAVLQSSAAGPSAEPGEDAT